MTYIKQTIREKLDIANAKRPVHHSPSRFGQADYAHGNPIGKALRDEGFDPEDEFDEFGKRRPRREPRSP